MKIIYVYSHLGGSEILQVRYPDMDHEINQVIAGVVARRSKASKEKTKQGRMLYSPGDMNVQFHEAFQALSSRLTL